MGVLLGLMVLIGLPWSALQTTAQEAGPVWQSFASAAISLVLGWLLGMVFVKTMGDIAVGVATGGFLAAVVAPFGVGLAYTPGYLCLGVVGVVVQRGQAQRMATFTQT